MESQLSIMEATYYPTIETAVCQPLINSHPHLIPAYRHCLINWSSIRKFQAS